MGRYFIDYSLTNGLGHPSVSLYLTGCDKPIKCKGCHNYELQEKSKKDYNIEEIITSVIKELSIANGFSNHSYFSILGGEPLTEYNREITYKVSKQVKQKFPDINIVLYSWRELKDIKLDIIEYIDYGVLGAYNSNKKQKGYLPASSNQYIINFNTFEKISPIRLNNKSRGSA